MFSWPDCVASVPVCLKWQAPVPRVPAVYCQPQVKLNACLCWCFFKRHLFTFPYITSILIYNDLYFREFRNLKPLRPTESSPTRLAVTKVWIVCRIVCIVCYILYIYTKYTIHTCIQISFVSIYRCSASCFFQVTNHVSCRLLHWQSLGPCQRGTKTNIGGFTGFIFHICFLWLQPVFLGRSMREHKAPSAVCGFQPMVGLKENKFNF